MYSKLQQRVYEYIRDDGKGGSVNSIISSTIMFIIIISVILVILETFEGFSSGVKQTFYYIEMIAVIIFTIEYLLRIWVAPYKYPEMSSFRARIKYIRSPMAVIDILAVIPFYLPLLIPMNLMALRALRLLRLLRLLKMNRYTNGLSSIAQVLHRKGPQLLSSMFAVLLLMIIASLIVHAVEYEAQPDAFSNAFSGLWWAMATLTTVGYGDIYPVTVLGKLVGAIIALLGIGLIAIPTGIISAGFMENMTEEKESEGAKKHFCPYCGEKIDN